MPLVSWKSMSGLRTSGWSLSARYRELWSHHLCCNDVRHGVHIRDTYIRLTNCSSITYALWWKSPGKSRSPTPRSFLSLNACSLSHSDVSPTVLGWTYCKNAWWKTAQRHNVWPTVQCPANEGDSDRNRRILYTGASRKPTLPIHNERTWPKTAYIWGTPSGKGVEAAEKVLKEASEEKHRKHNNRTLPLLPYLASPAKYVASSASQWLVYTATLKCTVQTLLERNHHHLRDG